MAVVCALSAGVGGPLVIAFVTEHVLFDHDLIGRSILLVCLPALVGAILSFAFARRAALRGHAAERAGSLPASLQTT